jgi:aspartate ammonia-lyase
MTLGQEFAGYAGCLAYGADDVERAAEALRELNLGATAVGTGLNAGPDFVERAIDELRRQTRIDVRPAGNRFRVTQSMGDVLAYSGALRRLAIELSKIASDLRLLSMGPRAGIAEISLPPVQPGSSIMPGTVNPSVPEMVNQVCFQVQGCDAVVAAACEAGQLELNVMMPVIAWNALHATAILRQAMIVLRERTIDGIDANAARCRELLDRSTAVATALSPYLGYEVTAEIAKAAVATGRPIREIVLERGLLPAARLDAILSVDTMTTPGVAGASKDALDHVTTNPPGARAAGARGALPGAGPPAARPAVPAGRAGTARRPRPRRVAEAGRDHGPAPDRRRLKGR